MNISLPFPPSGNRYWRNWRGRMVISEEGRAYCFRLLSICRALGLVPFSGPVAVTYRFYFPSRRGDLLNREKVLSDAIQGGVFVNDKQIVEAHQYMEFDKHNPRVEVECSEVPFPKMTKTNGKKLRSTQA